MLQRVLLLTYNSLDTNHMICFRFLSLYMDIISMVNFSKVTEMDFKTPTIKIKSSLLTGCNEVPSEQKKLDNQIPKPTEGELHQFFVNLSKTEGKPVLLITIPDFSDSYVPVSHLPNFPKPLAELFDPTAMTLF